MDEFKVSAIITTYKRPLDVLKRSLDSVRNQTYENLEIIIVDDSPESFEGRKLIEDYLNQLKEDRLIYIKHPKNMGANAARNTGINNSTGSYIAFLDDDDEWKPKKIELQMNKFDDEVGLVYCKAEVKDETSGKTRLVLNQIKDGYLFRDLLEQNFVGSNSFVLIRKAAIIEVGGYDEQLLSNQDYDLFLRIAEKYKITGVDDILVRYFIHEGDRISTDGFKQLQGRKELYQKFQEHIDNDKNLSLIWKIKMIPLKYKYNMKVEALSNLVKLLIAHPIFVLNYSKKTISSIKRKGEI